MKTPDVLAVRRALVSVFDKAGLEELGHGLTGLGIEILSTGSTATALRGADVPVTEVSEVTGFPEILDGRVKTLHPAVHAAILADRDKPGHVAALATHGIQPIDLVIVSLYPFRETVHRPGADEAAIIEMIDIGGPTMVRAAAKNHAHVGVVVDPHDYEAVLGDLRDHGGLSLARRRQLAEKAFAMVTVYDAEISAWFHQGWDFPPVLAPVYAKVQDLRYGENPHQNAAYYVELGQPWGLGSARQLQGKELSYNNLLDADAAWGVASDFADPCVVIVKHLNPAGLALGDTLAEAYPRALAGDPVSAFGGIVAVNRPLDAETARQIVGVFTEVVVAPAFTGDSLDVLADKANLRALEVARPEPPRRPMAFRSVSGGLLLQDADVAAEEESGWAVPTAVQPDPETLAELRFAWRACKHVKSNAIVLSRDRACVGLGAGQMSRVDSVRIAIDKSDGRHDGAVLASDAFFPFRDGPDLAIAAGVRAIIQPGGSVRDAEVVAACDEGGIPMVFTGRRHFRH